MNMSLATLPVDATNSNSRHKFKISPVVISTFLLSVVLVVFNIAWSLVGINIRGDSSSHFFPHHYLGSDWIGPYGLSVPHGPAVALPSVSTTEEEEASINRKFYGGKGDKPHLGGFTNFDVNGVSPTLWKHIVEWLGVKSLVDVGCGRGISTSWFILHGMEYVVCVEGSHDAVMNSLITQLENVPPSTEYELVEHDFSRGPWWPSRTVDAAWCVEFTEHVGRNYQLNYFTAFRKAALIFMTHSQRGGWHHVEVHDDDWWILRMESMGFVYSDYLTNKMKILAKKDRNRTDLLRVMDKDKYYSVGQHLFITLQVFLNPLVASLPQHAHLLAEHGCFHNGVKGYECGKMGSPVENITSLPNSFKPVMLTESMDKAWLDLIYDIPLSG